MPSWRLRLPGWGRPSGPGSRDAAARSQRDRPGSGPDDPWLGDPRRELARFGAALERLPFDELGLLAVRPADPAAHDAARQRAIEAARTWGRFGLVAEGQAAVRAWLDGVFAGRGVDPTPGWIAWRHGPLSPMDRRWLAETLGDAVLALATRGLVDPETTDELLGPCASLVEEGGR